MLRMRRSRTVPSCHSVMGSTSHSRLRTVHPRGVMRSRGRYYGRTPLLSAAFMGHSDILIALLAAQADINERDIGGHAYTRTPKTRPRVDASCTSDVR